MARKKRSPPSGDGAGPSRPQKRAKSTSRSVGPTSGFSENATGSSRLDLEVMCLANLLTRHQDDIRMNRKIEDQLQLAFQKMEELTQTEFNELKENLSIFQNPPDTNQSESFSENATGSSRLELEAINRKIDELLLAFQKRVQIEVNELKEKLSIPQNPPDTNQSESEQVDHGRYEIRITGAIDDCILTDSKVEGKDGGFLKVAICYNDKKVTSEPFASAKFEILVIKGDFCEEGSWTAETFQGSLVKAREEVGSILKNNSISKFASGEAVLDNLIFIDNSSWVEGKKWRLGIRLLKSNGVRVVEAISNCFRVYDRRRKAFEKLHPPSLTDGVEHLQKVGKMRALDLRKKEICTVKDFLQLFQSNQSRLLKILGINSEFDESWKTMIAHAKECDVGLNLVTDQTAEPLDRQPTDNTHSLSYDDVPDIRRDADQNIVSDHNAGENYDLTQDQTAGALDRQPADNTHSLSYDSVPDTGRDADQNIVADHNAGENYNSTQEFSDENLNQVQEQESAFVALNSPVEINSTSTHENMSVEEPCQDLSFQRVNFEGRCNFEDITMHFNPSPGHEADFHVLLRAYYVEQLNLEDILYRRRNIAKAWAIIKAMYVLSCQVLKKRSSCR